MAVAGARRAADRRSCGPSSRFLRAVGVDPDIIPKTTGYVHAIALGLPGGLRLPRAALHERGLGRTRPIMYCAIAGLALNVALNYVLMFGKLGFPRMGAVGCGLASAIALWCMFGADAAVRAPRRGIPCATHSSSAGSGRDPALQRELFAVGFPIGAALVVEEGLFAFVGVLMGTLGADGRRRAPGRDQLREHDLHGAARDPLGDDHPRRSGDGRRRLRRGAAARPHRHRALRRRSCCARRSRCSCSANPSSPSTRSERGRARRRREPALRRRHLPGVGRPRHRRGGRAARRSRTRACRCSSIC